ARGAAALRALRDAGLEADTVLDDDALWAAQRDGQRGATVLRVSATQERLGALLATARGEGVPVVARAAYGLAWLRLPDDAPDALAATVLRLRDALAPSPCVLLSGPEALRAAVDPWGPLAAPQLELMRRVKERFDPQRRCNPGLFAGAL
ncbi:FAD-linked oxidase C-terminal domain-containing protein, partial [Conexibacter stalactiti]